MNAHVPTGPTSAPTALRAILTPGALARVALGWLAAGLLAAAAPLLHDAASTPVLIAVLVATIGVVVVCALGVVQQAERLAERLGDPWGTLVLTLSIVLIEVVLIVAIMLGPGEHATIARDSVLAVSMIILNLVIGVALVAGGLRHGGLRHNRTGTSTYLGMLVALLALVFGLPTLAGAGGTFTPVAAVVVIVLTLASYGFFLWRQIGAQAGDYVEIAYAHAGMRSPEGQAARGTAGRSTPSPPTHRTELIARTAVLATTMAPIVLLSHNLAALLDDGFARLQAPPTLSGVIIAAIVFLPESVTAVRAAHRGEIQRVINLCHGALVSTVGLTIPAVLMVGLLTGAHPVFALDPVTALLLTASLVLSIATFSGRRVTAVHGSAHLVLFAMFVLTLFA
jgi:Ca2+:H+ antiporter